MEVTLYDLETGEETMEVSYYREPNEFEQLKESSMAKK